MKREVYAIVFLVLLKYSAISTQSFVHGCLFLFVSRDSSSGFDSVLNRLRKVDWSEGINRGKQLSFSFDLLFSPSRYVMFAAVGGQMVAVDEFRETNNLFAAVQRHRSHYSNREGLKMWESLRQERKTLPRFKLTTGALAFENIYLSENTGVWKLIISSFCCRYFRK